MEVKERWLYSIEEVAKIFSVSPVTVRYWARLGKIRTIKLGRRRLVPKEEVLRVSQDGLK